MFLELLKTGKVKIKRGCAFCGKLPPGSEKKHICIVISRESGTSNFLKYVFFTSQGAKARKRLTHDPKALVTIKKSEYPELRTTSYIQCDKAHVKSISSQELKKCLLKGIYTKVADPSDIVIEKIMISITESKTFSTQELKEIL